jgi:PAS domain-containing protein
LHYSKQSLIREKTKEVVSRRQSQTLLQLSEEVLQARDIDSYWALATEVLSRNDKDVPFVLLYSVEYSSSNPHPGAGKNPEHQQYVLQGSVGVPESSPAGPAHLDHREDWGFMPYVRQAITTREPTTVSFEEDSAIAKLFRDITSRGFGDPCRAATIFPLNPTSSNDNTLGFMVVGLNPRRLYDNDYRHFISIVSRMLSTSLISLRLHDEDIRRKEKAIADAEIMRLDLKQQLLSTQKEVKRSLYKFQRFAEGADIGIFILGLNGVYSYRNEAWYSILGTDRRNSEVGLAWDTLLDDEYVSVSQTRFQALIETKQHQYVRWLLGVTWRGADVNLQGRLNCV